MSSENLASWKYSRSQCKGKLKYYSQLPLNSLLSIIHTLGDSSGSTETSGMVPSGTNYKTGAQGWHLCIISITMGSLIFQFGMVFIFHPVVC